MSDQKAIEKPVMFSITHEGEHCGNTSFTKESAERHMAFLNAKYPGNRAIVPLYEHPLLANAAREELERDAKRYRFIKDDARGKFVENLSLRDAENWDSIIDAAMTGKEGD